MYLNYIIKKKFIKMFNYFTFFKNIIEKIFFRKHNV